MGHLNNEEDVEWIQKAINIQCDQINLNQIVYMLDAHIFDNLKEKIKEKLKKHKQTIIEFIKQHQIDGNKLIEMERKKFMNDIAAHLTNKKLTVALGYLYKDLMQRVVCMKIFGQIISRNPLKNAI